MYKPPAPSHTHTHDTAHAMWKKDATKKYMEFSIPRKSAQNYLTSGIYFV